MMLLLIVLLLVLATSDVWITSTVLKKFGVDAELNHLIVWAAKKYGLLSGICLGVYAPALLFILLAVALQSKLLLVFLIFVRAWLLYRQLRAHKSLLLETLKGYFKW